MKSSVIRSVAIFSNPEKTRARVEKPRLEAWLKRQKVKIFPISQLHKADAVITLGGDGTILAIASKAARAHVPVLGVNIGRLGFMTAVETNRLYSELSGWLKGKWTITERLLIEVTAPRVSSTLLALNDAVIRNGSTTRVTTVDVSVEDENLGHFTGDGVIVATPTGSTAYSLAAQGPVVHPEVEALILTPICPHSFTQRPVVFPKRQTVKLSLKDHRQGNEVQLCLDGQRVFLLQTGDSVTIRSAAHKLKLFQDPTASYFGILREKLLWGER